MARPARTEHIAPVLAEKVSADLPETQEAAPAIALPELGINDDIARIRALREKQPFGAFDRKLDLPPIEGYKCHWFNDKPGRIDAAKRAGWAHILDETGQPKSQVVNSGGLKGYAMKIPQQFWDEDQARQNAKAEAALAAVKKKPAGIPGKSQATDQGAFYTPNASGEAAIITRS